MSLYLGKTLITPIIKVGEGGITPTGTIELNNTELTNVSSYEYAQVVDSNLIPENILKGVSILGIEGTLEQGSGSGIAKGDSMEYPLTPREFNNMYYQNTGYDVDKYYWVHGYIYGMNGRGSYTKYRGFIADPNDCDDKENYLNNYKYSNSNYVLDYGDKTTYGALYIYKISDNQIVDQRTNNSVQFQCGTEVFLYTKMSTYQNMISLDFTSSNNSDAKMYIKDGLFSKWYTGHYWSDNVANKLEGSGSITLTDTSETTIANGLYTTDITYNDNSTGTVRANNITVNVDTTNLSPENIKKDISILGITGTLESGGIEKVPLPTPKWIINPDNDTLYIYRDPITTLNCTNTENWLILKDNGVEIPWNQLDLYASDVSSSGPFSSSAYTTFDTTSNASQPDKISLGYSINRTQFYKKGAYTTSDYPGKPSYYIIPSVAGEHNFTIQYKAPTEATKKFKYYNGDKNIDSITNTGILSQSEIYFDVPVVFTDSQEVALPAFNMYSYEITPTNLTLSGDTSGVLNQYRVLTGKLKDYTPSIIYTFDTKPSTSLKAPGTTWTACQTEYSDEKLIFGNYNPYYNTSFGKISFTLTETKNITIEYYYGLPTMTSTGIVIGPLDTNYTSFSYSSKLSNPVVDYTSNKDTNVHTYTFENVPAGEHFFFVQFYIYSSNSQVKLNAYVKPLYDKVSTGYYLPSDISVFNSNNELISSGVYEYSPYTGEYSIPMSLGNINITAIGSETENIINKPTIKIGSLSNIISADIPNIPNGSTYYINAYDASGKNLLQSYSGANSQNSFGFTDKTLYTLEAYATADGYRNSGKDHVKLWYNTTKEFNNTAITKSADILDNTGNLRYWRPMFYNGTDMYYISVNSSSKTLYLLKYDSLIDTFSEVFNYTYSDYSSGSYNSMSPVLCGKYWLIGLKDGYTLVYNTETKEKIVINYTSSQSAIMGVHFIDNKYYFISSSQVGFLDASYNQITIYVFNPIDMTINEYSPYTHNNYFHAYEYNEENQEFRIFSASPNSGNFQADYVKVSISNLSSPTNVFTNKIINFSNVKYNSPILQYRDKMIFSTINKSTNNVSIQYYKVAFTDNDVSITVNNSSVMIPSIGSATTDCTIGYFLYNNSILYLALGSFNKYSYVY